MAVIKNNVYSTDETDADNPLSAVFQVVRFPTPVRTIILDHGGADTEGNFECSLAGSLRNFFARPGQIVVVDLPYATDAIYLRHDGTAVNTWALGTVEA